MSSESQNPIHSPDALDIPIFLDALGPEFFCLITDTLLILDIFFREFSVSRSSDPSSTTIISNILSIVLLTLSIALTMFSILVPVLNTGTIKLIKYFELLLIYLIIYP